MWGIIVYALMLKVASKLGMEYYSTGSFVKMAPTEFPIFIIFSDAYTCSYVKLKI